MLEVLAAEPALRQHRRQAIAPRPAWRPLTKFETRGLKLGHGVWDLLFAQALIGGAQARQSTQPVHAVSSTSAPKTMRYQAKGTKSCVAM